MTALDALRVLVPASMRPGLRAAYTRLRHAGLRRRCNVCSASLRRFLAHGIPPEPDFLCPVCRSKPPHRLATLWFRRNTGVFRRGGSFLHVAPEAGLGRLLQARCRRAGMDYRAGSISGSGQSYMDLRRLPFADGSIDAVYCCHVLNCMQEDTVAMAEVKRVLAPGGIALLQVPAFGTGATTLETDGREDRLREFSDDGIYRRYTNEDYRRRLQACGFAVEEFQAAQVPAPMRERLQLKNEVLHLCRKQ